jgi:hypothetical protein
MMDDTPCCTNEALRRIKQIRINGILTGIAMLEKSITEVKALKIADRAGVKKELMDRVKTYNYIPGSAYDAYADAVLQEYLDTSDKGDGAR